MIHYADMKKTTATTIPQYNKLQPKPLAEISEMLAGAIEKNLPKSTSKIWHGSPVWFIDGNPIVAYSIRKNNRVSLMFFSGQSFEEKDLVKEGSFKAAEILYEKVSDIKITHLKRWLTKAATIQWDYKNIVKNKGVLKKINVTSSTSSPKNVNIPKSHDEKIASIEFSKVYPMYVTKVERKGRTKKELHQVITWLTGYSEKELQAFIKGSTTFESFFKTAKINPNAKLITGLICGYRVEDIKNPLTQKVRYLDKLVDELAKGRTLEKILRS